MFESNCSVFYVILEVTELISTLRIARMPLYEHTQAYHCNAEPSSVARVNQHSFSVTVFKGMYVHEHLSSILRGRCTPPTVRMAQNK
jgi:hypothetical protein